MFTEPGTIRDHIPAGRTLNEDRHAADVCALVRKWGRINPNMLARADAQSGSARALRKHAFLPQPGSAPSFEASLSSRDLASQWKSPNSPCLIPPAHSH